MAFDTPQAPQAPQAPQQPAQAPAAPSPVQLPTTMQAPQQAVPESHGAAFAGGIASARTPAAQQADPAFHSTSLLALPNMFKTGNAQSPSTFQQAEPYDSSMRAMIRSEAGGMAQQNG